MNPLELLMMEINARFMKDRLAALLDSSEIASNSEPHIQAGSADDAMTAKNANNSKKRKGKKKGHNKKGKL
jgi:hypothetical protein